VSSQIDIRHAACCSTYCLPVLQRFTESSLNSGRCTDSQTPITYNTPLYTLPPPAAIYVHLCTLVYLAIYEYAEETYRQCDIGYLQCSLCELFGLVVHRCLERARSRTWWCY